MCIYIVVQEESKNAREIVSLCQGILHLEALRTRTPEALVSDNNFLTLLNKYVSFLKKTSNMHVLVLC